MGADGHQVLESMLANRLSVPSVHKILSESDALFLLSKQFNALRNLLPGEQRRDDHI